MTEKDARPSTALVISGSHVRGELWTDEETAALVQMREVEGLSYSEIAARFGVTKHAALGRYHRAVGTEFPSLQRARAERVVKPHDDNWDRRLTEKWVERKKRRARERSKST